MPANKINSAILILGMYSSGGSVLARAFNLLGYGAPKTLKKENSKQTRRWESAPIASLNDRILESSGLKWSDWHQGELESLSSAERENYQKDIVRTIKSEFRGNKNIVLKDPRISRLAPLYLDALKSMNTKILPIIVFRNPLEVMASLRASHSFDEQDSAYLWLRYSLDAEKATRGHKRVFVQYSSFLDNWEDDLPRIQSTLGETAPISFDDARAQIGDFVDKGGQHHMYSAADSIHDERTEGWAATVYSALEVLQRNPTAEHPLEQIDLCEQEFESASTALHRLSVNQKGIFESQLKSAESDYHALRSEFDSTLHQLEELRQDSATREEEFATSQERLEHLRHDFGILQERHLTVLDEKARLERDLDAQEKHKIETAALIKTSDAEMQQLKAKLELIQSQFEERSRELEVIQQSAEEATALLAKERIEFIAERAKLDSEIEHQKAEINSIERVTNDQHELLDALRFDLTGAHESIKSLQLAAELTSDNLTREKEELAAERRHLTDKVRELERVVSRIGTESDRLKSELTISQSKLRKSEGDIGELLPRVKAREKELRQLKRQHWRLKDELAWQKDILHSIQASTSWRITAPIRKIRGMLSRRQSTAFENPSIANASAEKTELEQVKKNTENSTVKLGSQTKVNAAAHRRIERHVDWKEHIRAIDVSGTFDEAYYLANAPEAQTHSGSALEHYVLYGWKDGRDPSSTFVSNAWLASHPDLKNRNICPLYDFVRSTGQGNYDGGTLADVGKVAVFGAIIDQYDDLKEPRITNENVDYFLFTDGDEPSYSAWRKRHIEYFSHDPTRTARFIKTHPHLYFTEYDWAIWVDANLQIECDPRELVAILPQDTQFATWHHPIRDCIYEEARECLKRNKDQDTSINDMINFLRASHYPEKAGMYETSVVVYKQGDAKVAAFMNDWWSLIERFSRRDQLSLPVALDKHKLNMTTLARPGVCMRTDPRFVYHRHNR